MIVDLNETQFLPDLEFDVAIAGGGVAGISVAKAMADGKKAAISIDRYLRGIDLKKSRLPQAKQIVDVELEKMPRFVEHRERGQMPALPIGQRVASFKEVELGLAQEAAINEAKRCLNCPVCGNCILGRAQMCYETATRLL